VRQTRCRSLPASENVVGHQTPRKGRPCPRTACGRTWVFGHDYLRRTTSTWEWQWLPCPAIPSVRTHPGGSGVLDSSSGSMSSEQVRVDAPGAGSPDPGHRIRVNHLDVIPTPDAERDEAIVLAWRHGSTGSSAPRTARHRLTRNVSRRLRGGPSSGSSREWTCSFMAIPAERGLSPETPPRLRGCGGHRFRRMTFGSRTGTRHAVQTVWFLFCHGARLGRRAPGACPRCSHRVPALGASVARPGVQTGCDNTSRCRSLIHATSRPAGRPRGQPRDHPMGLPGATLLPCS
jgi:hypothetical protein